MCGRYAINASGQQIADAFELTVPGELERRYNVAPGQVAPVVWAGHSEGGTGFEGGITGAAGAREEPRELAQLLWGFHGASEPGRTVLNARIETAAERPSFREALARRRCLVPATGFYEWRRQGSARAPYHLQVVGSPLFAMAGLWSRWPQAGGEPRPAFVVLTTAPNELVATIHDRMPVIVDRELWSTWLGTRPLTASELDRLARPIDVERMSMYPVSSRVSSIRWDDPQCIAPVAEPPDQMALF